MDNLTNRSTSPMKYTDFLRKQAQDEIKDLPPVMQSNPSPVQPLISPQYTDLFLKLKDIASQRGGDNMTNEPSQGTQNSILSSPAPITQKFGNVNPGVEVFTRGGLNTGTDIGAPVGTKVALPPGEWKILNSYNNATGPGYIGNNQNQGYGNSILAQNLKTGEKLRFSHLSSVGVNPNQQLTGGSVIGATGATGNVTGPHLDLEYYDAAGRVSDILKSLYAAYLNMG